MNLKSQLRRTAALSAGTLIGLSGAFVLTEPANAHHHTVTGTAVCDTAVGDWAVTWKVNGIGDSPTYQWTQVDLTPAGKLDNPDIAVNGKDLKNAEELTGVQHVAATEARATLTVAAAWESGDAKETGTVTFAGKCEKAPTDEPSTPPTSEVQPPEDSPIFEFGCTTLGFSMLGPGDGVVYRVYYKTSTGEERDIYLRYGDKAIHRTFSATEGFSVDMIYQATYDGVTFGGSEPWTVEYERPAYCADAEGGGLPLTGTAAGGIAGGAGVLLAAGAGLFLMARRRKVNFTA